METLKGKTAVVTGASRGIGRAIGVALAREGMNLVIGARGKEALEATAQELSQQHQVKVVPVPCDVTKQADLENLADTALKEMKKVDALINSAGVSSQSPFQDQPLEDIERLMYTNYFGAVDPPPRGFIVYSSLKRALRAFGKGLFWELRDYGIKVSSILPGVADTALTSGLNEISVDKSRLISAAVVEDAVRFALSVPANVCPLEISVINQRTPWTRPVIPYKQDHPEE
jgi:short-subunit dehydrogenase